MKSSVRVITLGMLPPLYSPPALRPERRCAACGSAAPSTPPVSAIPAASAFLLRVLFHPSVATAGVAGKQTAPEPIPTAIDRQQGAALSPANGRRRVVGRVALHSNGFLDAMLTAQPRAHITRLGDDRVFP